MSNRFGSRRVQPKKAPDTIQPPNTFPRQVRKGGQVSPCGRVLLLLNLLCSGATLSVMAVEGGSAGMSGRRHASGSSWVFTGLAILGIWIAVWLAGFYSASVPGLPQASEFSLLGLLDRFWGVAATIFVIFVALKGMRAGAPSEMPWIGLAVAGAAVWAAGFLVSIVGLALVVGGVASLPVSAGLATPIVLIFAIWLLRLFGSSGEDPSGS